MASKVTRVQCKDKRCNFVVTHVFENIALQFALKHSEESRHEVGVETLVIPQQTGPRGLPEYGQAFDEPRSLRERLHGG